MIPTVGNPTSLAQHLHNPSGCHLGDAGCGGGCDVGAMWSLFFMVVSLGVLITLWGTTALLIDELRHKRLGRPPPRIVTAADEEADPGFVPFIHFPRRAALAETLEDPPE